MNRHGGIRIRRQAGTTGTTGRVDGRHGHGGRWGRKQPETVARVPHARATWHRRVELVPIGYLAAIVAVGLARPVISQGRWLLVHLLLLGAVTNAILVWSVHFTNAVLRSPAPARRHGEAARLVVLNAGVLAVLVGGLTGPGWLGAAGAGVVSAAVLAHLGVLAAKLRRALPAPFTVTVHYYLVATVALLAGIPAGAWMLLAGDTYWSRLLLFHTHVNLLGWVTVTILGTLLTLWPTVLRTRMVDGATRATIRALPLCMAALVLLSVGTLAWWPILAVAGLAVFAIAVVLVARPFVATACRRPPASFATWSIAAGMGWLLVALGWDAWILARADGADGAAGRFGALLIPLAVGFIAQVLIGSLAYLLPMALGGGPTPVRRRTARLDRFWPQRVTMANLALAVSVLPVPPYVRIAGFLLILAALLQFLIPALIVLISRKKLEPDVSVPPTPDASVAAAHAPVPAVRPWGGIALGVALVLVAAVMAAVVGRRAADRDEATTTNSAVTHARADVDRGGRDAIQVTDRTHRAMHRAAMHRAMHGARSMR